MLNIGIVGCGLQAATIAGYLSVFGDEYQVGEVVDINLEFARARIAEKQVRLSPDCRFYADINDFLKHYARPLNGIIIGTFCAAHTEVACRLEPLNVPLYLEKPAAISLPDLKRLYQTFLNSKTSVQVSLPMRLCPLTQAAKRIIDRGEIGTVEQVIGYESQFGDGYFRTWFRDCEKTGGMFMQKAVHDIDYMFYLAGSRPKEVCAMAARRVFGGDKPENLSCDNCPEMQTCPESPLVYFRKFGYGNSVEECTKYRYGKRLCCFSRAVTIDDMNECTIEMESGAHIAHTQNFFARSGRRGAWLYGSKGALEINFDGHLQLVSNKVEEIKINQAPLSHYGGDAELICDFLNTMKTGEHSRTDLISGDGIYSTLACLCARKSAEQRKFVPINWDQN